MCDPARRQRICHVLINVPPAPPPAPNRRAPRARICRRPNCWALVAHECLTGYCQEHCTSSRCECVRPRNGPERSLCRRNDCQASVNTGCRTGYCQAHCFSCTCCNRAPNRSSAFAGPLQQYLSDVCSSLPVAVSSLLAHIRESFHTIRAFAHADGSGNGCGSRRRSRMC